MRCNAVIQHTVRERELNIAAKLTAHALVRYFSIYVTNADANGLPVHISILVSLMQATARLHSR